MFTKYRVLLSKVCQMAKGFQTLPLAMTSNMRNNKAPVLSTLGFSIFTWLGFETTKLTAEDELIKTIKHCVLFIQREEYEKAEQLLHIALRQAQQIHHQLGITYIYDVMANLALEKEQLDKAKQLFVAVTQRLLSDGVTEDDSRVVHISAKLARIQHLKKEYETAKLGFDWCLEKLNKAIAKEPSENLIKLLAMTEDWYGRLYLDCNQSEQGLALMIKSLNHMKNVTDIEQEHIVLQLNDIGTVYDRLGKTDESIGYFSEAIDLGTQLEDKSDLGVIYVNLGRAYLKKSLFNEARKKCGFAWRLGEETHNKEIKSEAMKCIGEINKLC